MTDPRILWPNLMQAASRFNVGPHQFWRLSVREWRILNAAPRGETLPRSALERLMTTFPDGAARG